MTAYREARDPKVASQHPVEMREGAPGHIVSTSAGGGDQQNLVLKPHHRLLLVGASLGPETWNNAMWNTNYGNL